MGRWDSAPRQVTGLQVDNGQRATAPALKLRQYASLMPNRPNRTFKSQISKRDAQDLVSLADCKSIWEKLYTPLTGTLPWCTPNVAILTRCKRCDNGSGGGL